MVELLQDLQRLEDGSREFEGTHPLPEGGELLLVLPAGDTDEDVLLVGRTEQGAAPGPRLGRTDAEGPVVPPGDEVVGGGGAMRQR